MDAVDAFVLREPSGPPGGRGARLPRVLVVDDEADLRELLELTLVGMGFDVDCAPDLATAQRLLEQKPYALCLTDMRLPDGDGLQLVESVMRRGSQVPIAVITAYGSAENAVAALKAGAFDYLAKPVALDALRSLVRAAVAAPSAATEPVSPAREAARKAAGRRLIGDSAVMREVRAQIERLARSMAPVAITGESGSGKELAARLIHESGARAQHPFVAVNCGAIPEALMEAEFFGHRKGAFTGADQERDGFFQAASGGTLFLDEVADLPLPMQVKLLRAIQEKRVRKVGATMEEQVDVRIISATHQDLGQCVAAGRFRHDLYYRLNVIELKLPPLRERSDDLAELCESMLQTLAARAGLSQVPKLSSVTLRYLQSYPFPGNVRELENLLERALAFSNGETINVEDLGLRPVGAESPENERAESTDPQAGHLPPDPARSAPWVSTSVEPLAGASVETGPIAAGSAAAGSAAAAADGSGFVRAEGARGAGSSAAARSDTGPGAAPSLPTIERRMVRISEDGIPDSLPDYLEQIEREAIQRALEKTRHNRTAAAKLLGITFRALRYRMQRLDLN